jgi:hypothetical protein
MDSETAVSDYIEIDSGFAPARAGSHVRSRRLGLFARASAACCIECPALRRARPIVACYHQYSKIKPLILQVIEQARHELQTVSHPVVPE